MNWCRCKGTEPEPIRIQSICISVVVIFLLGWCYPKPNDQRGFDCLESILPWLNHPSRCNRSTSISSRRRNEWEREPPLEKTPFETTWHSRLPRNDNNSDWSFLLPRLLKTMIQNENIRTKERPIILHREIKQSLPIQFKRKDLHFQSCIIQPQQFSNVQPYWNEARWHPKCYHRWQRVPHGPKMTIVPCGLRMT